MAGVMLGLGRFRSRLCHQSTRRDVGDVVVPWPSLVASPSMRNRRSARESPWSAQEEGDDRWGRVVSDTVFENDFSIFQKWMNSDTFCYFCIELFRAPKIMKFFV